MPKRDSDYVNTVGEPDEGKPHVRFDEGRLGRLRLNQSPTLPSWEGRLAPREDRYSGSLVLARETTRSE